mmetsp:Transcript_26310/g.58898  ORF Transcript_26310/g.58898 Transcript_26310/m.58898 type:complete len:130 (-) Transcript_26310:191-580(-)
MLLHCQSPRYWFVTSTRGLRGVPPGIAGAEQPASTAAVSEAENRRFVTSDDRRLGGLEPGGGAGFMPKAGPRREGALAFPGRGDGCGVAVGVTAGVTSGVASGVARASCSSWPSSPAADRSRAANSSPK